MEYYKLVINDRIKRKLPIVKTKSGINIAGFDCVGDIKLIEEAGRLLVRNMTQGIFDKCDYIITTELKGIPIAQEISRYLEVPYICLRKEPKVYMGKCVELKGGNSITSGETTYYISKDKLNKLKGKNVIFVDDVYSTGGTLNFIDKFCAEYNIKLLEAFFILIETNEKIKRLNKEVLQFYHCENNLPKYKCTAVERLPLPNSENKGEM